MNGTTNYHAGLEAERSVARSYLRLGYKFAAHRYRGKSGEIDLIMRRDDDVVFVEVKKSKTHALAAESLSTRQMGRIYRSASEFLSGEPTGQDTPTRFDVALVDGQGRVDILQNAFAA